MFQNVSKKVSLLIGALALIVGGLFYILFTDIKLLNTSTWLFLAIFPAFGSGIGFILAENIKKKLFWRFFVKGLGVILAVVFVFVLFNYMQMFNPLSPSYNDEVIGLVRSSKKLTTDAICAMANGITTTSLVFGITGGVFQVVNIVLDIIYKVED